MSAIESCRTAALGGHVEACSDCGHQRIAYNSCRNRHCPRCQGAAARTWLEAQEANLLPVGYFHVVFTMPTEIADIAFHNKALVYDLLFKAASQTMLTIAADPKHLGARIGITAVLHTWGSAMTHHPHIHMIVPGGGLSPDGTSWVACRPGFFLHVRVLSRLFRRLFLEGLMELHRAGQLAFFGDLGELADADTFTAWRAPFRKSEWVVYAKPPFGGPEAVLAYLSRYTHRVAISNARLVSADADTVAFRWKDYRIKSGDRQKVMRLATPEFIRRFLIHVLPDGLHRIRHYGLLASSTRKANITKIRTLLCVQRPEQTPASEPTPRSSHSPCANHAPVAAAPCASSKSSGAGKSRHHEHRQGSRPHDKSPVTRHGNPPAAIRRLDPNSLCLFTSSVARSGNDTETNSFVGILSRACERIGHHTHLQPHP